MRNNTTITVIVLGAGGHAKVIAESLIQSGYKVSGFITPDLNPGVEFFGSNILGDDNFINKFSPNDIVLANGIGSLPRNDLRYKLAIKMRERGYKFATIVHPSAIIASDVEFNEGVQVMAGAVIRSGTRIGRDTIVNTGVLLDHDCNIASNCHLAPGVVCCGGVTIEEGTHVGTGTMITENRSIGRKCVIAAGSVIYKDVSDKINFIQRK